MLWINYYFEIFPINHTCYNEIIQEHKIFVDSVIDKCHFCIFVRESQLMKQALALGYITIDCPLDPKFVPAHNLYNLQPDPNILLISKKYKISVEESYHEIYMSYCSDFNDIILQQIKEDFLKRTKIINQQNYANWFFDFLKIKKINK